MTTDRKKHKSQKEVKTGVIIILNLLIGFVTLGQSPFNYGQNKDAYFISSELRKKLNFDTIYILDRSDKNYENDSITYEWDETVISFNNNQVEAIISHFCCIDSNININNFSSGQPPIYQANETFVFKNGKLQEYGIGAGVGYWKYINRYSDSISIVETTCVGHCVSQPNGYSKNVFNLKGRLVYTVLYPRVENVDDDYETFSNSEGKISLSFWKKIIRTSLTANKLPDTLFYYYDSKGLLLGMKATKHSKKANDYEYFSQSLISEWINKNKITTSKEALKLYNFPDHAYQIDENINYHQIFVGDIIMEEYFQQKFGFKPKLVLIEIYPKGVFVFILDKNGKYYKKKNIILEQ
jgi:hypothetical protein